MLERWETLRRRMPVIDHGLINQLAARADDTQLGATLPRALADRLRITRGEANRRVAEAADLGERRALTGEPLAPVLTATAAAQREGKIGATHVRSSAPSCAGCPMPWTSRPGRKPKHIWPGWPPSFGLTKCPGWPTD